MIETLAEADAAIHAADNWPANTARAAWALYDARALFYSNSPAERFRQEPECTIP